MKIATDGSDPLSMCVNASFIADVLDEYADIKATLAAKGNGLISADRLMRWSESDRDSADLIRHLVRIIEGFRASESQKQLGEGEHNA